MEKYVGNGPSGNVHYKLAGAINVIALIICLFLTLIPIQINSKDREFAFQLILWFAALIMLEFQ